MNPESPEPGALRGLFREVVAHPVAVTMVVLAALVFGWVSYGRLPVELMPDISYPTLTVRTLYEGAAPQEVESQVSRPVEEALATLDGLVTIESRSRAGASDVVLGFDWGTDMGGVSQTIRENLQTTWLPDGTDRPLLLRYDPSLDPFLRLALSAEPTEGVSPDQALLALREIAEREVKRELEGMEGVAAVRVRGGLERELRVEVREDWLAARRVTLEQVQAALGADNVNIAGGSVLEGDVEYLVRTVNQLATVDDIREVRILRDDGVRVPLGDVAIVRETYRERTVESHLDGDEAVELEIFKEADANVVEVAERVKGRLFGDDALGGGLPDGVELLVLDDQAAFIGDAVTNLRDTAVLGGFFAVGVLFLFLRDYRATAIIGLAIPISVVIGFAPLHLQGVTLNLMSLGGLALGVGMLVDNAVVVLESIQRYRELGHDRARAAVLGVSDVAGAVVASTLTTLAVFFPISFVEGVAGEMFGDLALAVVSSLSASLAVALFLVPTLAALEWPSPGPAPETGALGRLGSLRVHRSPRRFARELWGDVSGPPRQEYREARAAAIGWRRIAVPYLAARCALGILGGALAVGVAIAAGGALRLGLGLVRRVARPISAVLMAAAGGFQALYRPQERAYARLLQGALRRPGSVAMLAGGLLAVSLVGLRGVGTELIPSMAQGRFTVETALPVGTPLEVNREVVRRAEARVAAHPDVRTVYATVGADARVDARSDEGEHTARIRVELREGADETAVMEALRRELASLPRLDLNMSRPALFSFRTPVEVVLFGWDLDRMRAVGEQVVSRLEGIDGLRDVRSSLVAGHPEVRIRYDRERLRRLGLDPATVAGRVRDKLQGVEATGIQQGDDRVELRVQLVEHDRGTLADLRSLNVNPELIPEIPLSAVADIEEAEGPSEIRRVDQQRAVVVSANVAGFDLGSTASAIEAALSELALPAEVTWEVAGQAREMKASMGSLQFALLLAVFLVYVIMACTFENVVHPLVILFAVPLALVGVTAGLLALSLPLSVVVFIGFIVLAGVVVNNAIVLVDTVNRLRDDGTERLEAIREAGRLRLRPILITTATTALGLLPLSLGFGAGAELQQPLAVTVIAGLVSSTALTLLVVPALYAMATGLGRGAST